MEDIENDEMEMDGLKLPSDAEDEDDDDGEESGPGLDDYDDEDDFAQGMIDEYGQEGALKEEDDDEDEDEDGEAEIEDVFARANDNQEMDVVENLRRAADSENVKGSKGDSEGYINADLVKKIE